MDELAIIRQSNDFKSEASQQIKLIKKLSNREKAEILPQVTFDRLVLQNIKKFKI
jgi:hypothetical protein